MYIYIYINYYFIILIEPYIYIKFSKKYCVITLSICVKF